MARAKHVKQTKWLEQHKIGFKNNVVLIVGETMKQSWEFNLKRFNKKNLFNIDKPGRILTHKNGTIFQSITFDMVPHDLWDFQYCDFIIAKDIE